MSTLRDLLKTHVDNSSVAGAVGLVARGDQVDVQAVGLADVGGAAPMTRDSIFRIASITKPIVAAAVMVLVEDGRIGLHDPVDKWLPELASPVVIRTPESPVDDVVPALRPITVHDLLTSRAGYGFPAADGSLPAIQALLSDGQQQFGRDPQFVSAPDEWLAGLAKVPLLHQPGEAFLYNTCSDLQGVLVARVSGAALPDFLAERLFEPVGMVDTGFHVPAAKFDRMTSYYRTGLELVDGPDGQWSSPPAFPSGAGGLVSTVDDWLRFGRMLLADGGTVLSPESVRQMTTDHLTRPQREAGALFLEGQGWGFGGTVDIASIDPWNVPGRYGWVGGTGTAAHITPSTGAVTVLLTQLAMNDPTTPAVMRDFWRYAADA
jgi:CubicO group peptidase (beta-lactamase class C family)